MESTSNKILAGTRLAINEHGRSSGRHRLHKFQDTVQRLARADDLIKLSYGTNLVLKIKLFLSEFVREFRYLAVGQRVFYSNRYLTRNLNQKVDIIFREGTRLQTREPQYAQHSSTANQWQPTGRLKTLTLEVFFITSSTRPDAQSHRRSRPQA